MQHDSVWPHSMASKQQQVPLYCVIASGMGIHTHVHAEAGCALITCVDRLGWPPEVKAEGQAVGKHGQRASCLLVASDLWDIAQPLGMDLRATASHIHTNL